MNINEKIVAALQERGAEGLRFLDSKEVADYSFAELVGVHPTVCRTVAEMVRADWVESADEFERMGLVADFSKWEGETDAEFTERRLMYQEARVVPLADGKGRAVLAWDISSQVIDQFGAARIVMAPASLIDQFFRTEESMELTTYSDGESIQTWLRRVLAECYARKAADIEITTFATAMRIRIHTLSHWGAWIGALPVMHKGPLLNNLCAMATPQTDFWEGTVQDFKIEARLAGVDTSWRVSILPAVAGESITMRILPQVGRIPPLTELGYPPEQVELIRRGCSHKNGLVLITGAVGSGKTTTLYAVVDELNRARKKIISIEQPVELQIPGVVQVEEKSGEEIESRYQLTFAGIGRASLRHKPDVIMVGETRDHETAMASVHGSAMGHLAMTTLHTNSVSGSIQRMADLGVPSTRLADFVRLCVSQRLIRKLCACSHKQPDGTASRNDAGCEVCAGTGYEGKVVVAEMVYLDNESRASVVRGAFAAELPRLQAKGFYFSRIDSAQALYRAGVIDEPELNLVVEEDE